MYFALQAMAVAGWWVLLWVRPEYRAAFTLEPASQVSLLAFGLPDLVLLAGGSAVASLASFRSSTYLMPSLWMVAGAVSYATLYCLFGSVLSDSAWLGVLLMAPAMLLSVTFAMALSSQACLLFRKAAPASPRWNLTKTFGQTLLFWSVLLFVVPSLLVDLQQRAGLPVHTSGRQAWAGGVLFVLFSLVGLWSGLTMARLGEGTPLPLDSPRALVVQGPYAYVRNPMAVAGLGQGLAVGVYTGSVVVIGYVVLGSLLWQCIARPLEEADLAESFGEAYTRYRSEVRCWIPRRSPYRPQPPGLPVLR